MPDRVTVILDEAEGSTAEVLADRLRRAGMQVEQVLDEIGMIIGTLPREHRAKVSALPGVAGIEDEATFQPPPPDEAQ
jgi:hypothetical protein